MALTSTEENQLRELLRRMNATQSGKTVDQLTRIESGSGVTDVVIRKTGGGLARASQDALIDSLLDNSVRSTGARRTTADQSINHLMTREATRSEITRLTDSRITNAQNTANSAVTANDATLRLAQGTEARARALESWKDSTVDPQLRQRYKAIGSVFASNPGIQVGALNRPGVGIEPRTHRFNVPMAENPLILFSLYGDANYPRFELINENGKIAGFMLFHQPTAGLWMAVGTPA
jgi:hypothetical protein